MNKEVIKLLRDYCKWCMAQGGVCRAHLDGCAIFDAIALLEKQPDCKPEATEFVRRARLIATHELSKPRTTMEKCILETCDIIDRQAEQIKRLEEAVKTKDTIIRELNERLRAIGGQC